MEIDSLIPPDKNPNEKLGIIYCFIATFFMSLNLFFAKIIQRAYKNEFNILTFLFLRGLSILIFSIIHAKFAHMLILKPKEIPFKIYFLIRTNLNFFYNAFATSALFYLRASTVQMITLLSPIIVIILSYFILNEPFYNRYFIGGIMCILGSFLIVLSEKNYNNNIDDKSTRISDICLGAFLSVIAAFFAAFVNLASKVLASNNVPVHSQIFYTGVFNMFYSFIFIFFSGGISFKLGYVFMCCIHGLFFYLDYYFFNKSLQFTAVSKVILITYLQIVFVVILAFIFLKENIYIGDFIGAGLMIGYLAYNSINPIKN